MILEGVSDQMFSKCNFIKTEQFSVSFRWFINLIRNDSSLSNVSCLERTSLTSDAKPTKVTLKITQILRFASFATIYLYFF